MISRVLTINPAPVMGRPVRKSEDNSQVVQSIWHKAHLFTKKEASAWCVDHDFKVNDYRSRKDDDGSITHHIHAQFDPAEGIEDTWAFISDDFPDGISASTCQRKDKSMNIKFTKGTQSEEDPFEFIMSDESVDRMGDVIMAKGWDLSDFKANPIALWGHDHRSPIGLWENVRIVGKQLRGKLVLAKQGTSAEIDTLRSLVEQRILKAVSVGFAPIEYEPLDDDADKFWGPFKFLKQALHETSLVSVPANPNALAVAKSCGMSRTQMNTFFEQSKSPGRNAAPLAKIEEALRDCQLAGRPKT